MATIKKAVKKAQKAKSGASFPDLNKDGKITKADILKGRGVIAKSGMKMKKAQDGETMPDYRNMSKVRKNATAKDSADYKSGFQKVMSGKAENFPNRAEKYGQNEAARRKSTPKKSGKLKNLNIFSDGGSTKKAKVGAKMKMGGKCKNGC